MANYKGRGPKVLSKITYKSLASLFKVSERTIKRRITHGELDPTNLEKIVDDLVMEKIREILLQLSTRSRTVPQ